MQCIAHAPGEKNRIARINSPSGKWALGNLFLPFAITVLYHRPENGMFATSFRHILQLSIAKLCLLETLLNFQDKATANHMEKFKTFFAKINVML